MITYSLQNLLLDAPELDHESLLGPVIRMRWMSNLIRLAVLEEADELRAAAGEYTEHDSEIRRLRRSSMAPDAGRYYPVEGRANRVFARLLPEQARQIVDHFLARQHVPFGDSRSSVDTRSLDEPNDWDPDEQPTPPSDERRSKAGRRAMSEEARPNAVVLDRIRPRAVVLRPDEDDPEPESPADSESEDDFEENDFEDSDGWSDDEYREDQQGSDPYEAPPLRIPSHHPLIDHREAGQWEEQEAWMPDEYPPEHELHASRFTRFVDVAIIALVAAVLFLAATWFLDSRIQTPASPPMPAEFISTPKIVPSAVPRRSLDFGWEIGNLHPKP